MQENGWSTNTAFAARDANHRIPCKASSARSDTIQQGVCHVQQEAAPALFVEYITPGAELLP